MAVKGKKRSAESSGVESKKIDQQTSKKKLKVEKVEPVEQTNGAVPNKKKKLEKKTKPNVNNKNVTVSKPENGTAPSKVAVKTEKKDAASKNSVKTVNEGAKVAAIIKQKVAKKLEKEKNIVSLAPELITATVEELQKRINEIVNRETITKTGRRRLGVLKKKLAIKQGTLTPTPVNQTQEQTVSKNTKRKLRRMKKALEIKNEKKNGSKTAVADNVKSQAEKAAKAVKGVKPTMAEKKAAENTKVGAKHEKKAEKKNKQVGDKMKTKKAKVEVKAEEDIEEDDEEVEDEEQNESMDVSNGSVNTVDGEDDDDEDDEDDEDEEDEDDEDEIEVKKLVSKPKKDNKKLNPKLEKKVAENDDKKAKSDQNKPNAKKQDTPKKSRYVLFVGNVPFTAREDEIKNHFLTKVSKVRSVRIPLGPENEPRGFCYVELSNSVDYEKGLSLHETHLKGNRIRVQYSLPKEERSKQNAVGKNKKLHTLRKQGKLAGSTKDSQKRNARRNKEKNQAA